MNCLNVLAFKKFAFPSIKINTEELLELTKKAGLGEAFMVKQEQLEAISYLIILYEII